MSVYRFEKVKENDVLWNKFIKSNNLIYTVASNPSIVKILSKTFTWNGENIFVFREDKIIGLFNYMNIGNKIVSMPHFSYGGLLVSNDFSSETSEIYSELYEYIGVSSFEIRSFNKLSKYNNSEKVTSFLYLKENAELQFKDFKSKLRSQIKKGYKNALTGKCGGVELLDDFYNVYSKNMHSLGSPVLSKVFFKNILQDYEYGEAKIFCVLYQGKVIGASIVLSYLNFSEVCWASTLQEYNKLSTNMVLYWEMIKYVADKDFDIFSYGRGSKDGTTYKFKLQWGTKEKQLYFNYSEEHVISLKKVKFLSKVWSKMPLKIANYLGPIISERLY